MRRWTCSTAFRKPPQEGLWDPKETTLERLEAMYLDIEERPEMLTDR